MVRTAARLFRRQGYAATGWRQIVAESGAPWGSQAHYFPGGKEQLATEALAFEGERIQAEMEEALGASHPADMIEAWSRVAARRLRASDWGEGCPVATVALETAHESERLARVCDSAFKAWAATFERALVLRGLSPTESASLATLVVASTEGALLLARAAHKTEALQTTGAELARLLRTRVP